MEQNSASKIVTLKDLWEVFVHRLWIILLAAIAAALAAYIVLLVIFLMDDRIKTDEDIQQMLGLSVLASIPCADGKKTGKYGYYRAYGAKERRPYQEKKRGAKAK